MSPEGVPSSLASSSLPAPLEQAAVRARSEPAAAAAMIRMRRF